MFPSSCLGVKCPHFRFVWGQGPLFHLAKIGLGHTAGGQTQSQTPEKLEKVKMWEEESMEQRDGWTPIKARRWPPATLLSISALGDSLARGSFFRLQLSPALGLSPCLLPPDREVLPVCVAKPFQGCL